MFCVQVHVGGRDLGAHKVSEANRESLEQLVHLDLAIPVLKGRLELQATQEDLAGQATVVRLELLALPVRQESDFRVCARIFHTWLHVSS